MKNVCSEAVTSTAQKTMSGSEAVVELANSIVNISEKISQYCIERLAIITPPLPPDEIAPIKESPVLSPLFGDLYAKLRRIEFHLWNINMAIAAIDL